MCHRCGLDPLPNGQEMFGKLRALAGPGGWLKPRRRDDIARAVGVSTDTLRRMLRELERAGRVELRRYAVRLIVENDND